MAYKWRGTGLTYFFESSAERDAFLANVQEDPSVSNVAVNGLQVTLDFDNTGA